MVGAPSFSQPILWIQPTLQSYQETVPFLQSIFTSLNSPLLVYKIILTIPTNTLFLYNSANFSPPSFCVQPSKQSTPKIFSLPQKFCQFRLRQGIRELGSIVKTDTVLISPFFLKVWTVIAGLTHNHWFFIAQTHKIALLQVRQTIQYTFAHTLNLF